MNTDDLITKIIKTGNELDPWNQGDPDELREECREMLQTVDGCKMIIDGLLDTIKDLIGGKKMVIIISNYAGSEQKKQTLDKCFAARGKALKIAYSIPGYKDKPLKEKNAIYDTIIKKILEG